jgi:hypothetical protein
MKPFIFVAAVLALSSSLALACTEGEKTTINGKKYTCSCSVLSNGQKICEWAE